MKNNQQVSKISRVGIAILFFVFALSGVLLVTIGLNVYKNIVLANDGNFELRTSLSYVATKIRQNDTLGKTSIKEKDGVTVLVMGEEVEGEVFETLIYHYDGYLRELYKEKDAEYELNYGFEIMEVEDFAIEETEEGLLILKAENKAGDTQTLSISLRTKR